MKIVAEIELQRLNCGFTRWQVSTTELLVRATSTSIKIEHKRCENLCNKFHSTIALQFGHTWPPPHANKFHRFQINWQLLLLDQAELKTWRVYKCSFSNSLILFQLSLHPDQTKASSVPPFDHVTGPISMTHEDKKLDLSKPASFQFCASDDIPQRIGCTPAPGKRVTCATNKRGMGGAAVVAFMDTEFVQLSYLCSQIWSLHLFLTHLAHERVSEETVL